MSRLKSTVSALGVALVLGGAFVTEAVAQRGSAATARREVLPADARPVSYAIEVTPDAASLRFAGTMTATFEVLQPTSRIVVNGADLTVRNATVDGQAARVSTDAALERLTFTVPQPLARGRHTLTVAYDGKINESASGLFSLDYPAAGGRKRVLVTQFEPGDARRLAPMWDEPAHKATFDVSVVITAEQDAVSNMPIVSTTPQAGGRKRVAFAPSVKMSSYLLFLGVGDLDRITATSGGVEHGIVTRAGEAEKGRFALAAAQQLTPFYNEYFGTPYPLPKLDQIAGPGAGGFGAMENWGAIFYFESALLVDPAVSTESDRQGVYGTVAHEIAHQWFGNLVTMSWWDDLWLNEGFASWMASKVTAQFHPEWNPWLRSMEGSQRAMSLDAQSSTHPVVQTILNLDQANQAFDDITYRKGLAVIRMLEAYLGEDAFREGVRAYMKRHAYGNTVTTDLWRELETASGVPVTAVARDFTTQPGVPLITVTDIACRGGRSVVDLRQGRFGVDAASKRPLSWRTPVVVSTVGGGEAKALVTGSARITAPGCGPVKVNAGHAGYFRTLYPQAQFDRLAGAFETLPAADQLGLMYDAYALGAAGIAPLVNYLTLADRVAADADPLVWSQLLASLNTLTRLNAGRPSEAALRAYAVSRLKPKFDAVGWTARQGEPDNLAVLRNDLITTLAALGDPAVVAEARRRYAAGGAQLPGAIRRPVIRVVGASADTAAWEQLRAAAMRAESPLEQRLYLQAMAAVNNPALARRSLDLFMTDATPKSLAPSLVRSVAQGHPDLGWSWYLANEAAVKSRLDPLQRLQFPPSIAASSNSPARMAELRAYAAKSIPAGSRASVDEAVSQMTYNAGVIAQRLPELDRWLAARSGNTK